MFPRFADDHVIQHCVEEALMARVDIVNLRDQQARHNRDAVKAAQDKVAEVMARLRRG